MSDRYIPLGGLEYKARTRFGSSFSKAKSFAKSVGSTARYVGREVGSSAKSAAIKTKSAYSSPRGRKYRDAALHGLFEVADVGVGLFSASHVNKRRRR